MSFASSFALDRYNSGFKPIFVDINHSTLGLDTEKVLSSITKKTKADDIVAKNQAIQKENEAGLAKANADLAIANADLAKTKADLASVTKRLAAANKLLPASKRK